MAGQLRLRRGTTSQLANYTGAQGELTYDTALKSLVLHDGVTLGGVKIPYLSNGLVPSTMLPTATDSVIGASKIATTAIAQAGTNDTDIITSLKLKQTVFGLNQTLSNVTASRVAGTTYTNTTPYPKIVIITNTALTSGSITLDTSLGELCRTTRNASGAMTAVIPKGVTYTLSSNAGTSFIWWEF